MKNGILGLAACMSVTLAAAAASAGQVFVGDLGQTGLLNSSFVTSGLAGEGVDGSLLRQIGVTGRTGNALNFGASGSMGASVATFARTAGTTGSFYLDAASGLGNNWFDSGVGLVRPDGDTIALAFGQSGGLNADDITVTFAPGVQAFGFNFTDVGDQGGAFMVSFSDSTSQSIAFNDSGDAGSFDLQSGYIALIASAGKEITSLRLMQPTAANDGVAVYGFNTLAVVPLPPAAWAGLAMLGGVAGVRRLRRRG
jgi:hypothetical protein